MTASQPLYSQAMQDSDGEYEDSTEVSSVPSTSGTSCGCHHMVGVLAAFVVTSVMLAAALHFGPEVIGPAAMTYVWPSGGHNAADVSRPPVAAAQSAYLSVYSRWLSVCSDPITNSVMRRGDGWNLDEEALRPWSLTPRSVDTEQPACNSTAALLQSARLGRRELLDPSLNGTGSELIPAPTAFVPFGCAPRYPSAEEMCDAVYGFAHVTIVGDSLSRHLSQALHMLLNEDMRYGGLPRHSSNAQGLYDRCQCDGQFSEHAACREYHGPFLFEIPDLRAAGVCYQPRTHSNPYTPISATTNATSNTTSIARSLFAPTRFDYHFHAIDINTVTPQRYEYLCFDSQKRPDTRPRLVVLQAALHFYFNLTKTIEFFDQMIKTVDAAAASCPGGPVAVHYLGIAGTTQVRANDARFPHQSRESVSLFNEQLLAALAAYHPKLPMIEFLPLAFGAQSSDGVHQLSDVNLVKATYVYQFMNIVLTQSRATATTKL